MPAATPEALDEFILACRYGEDDGVRGFADAYGWDAAVGARDDRGNSGLHMACGNGHLGGCFEAAGADSRRCEDAAPAYVCLPAATNQRRRVAAAALGGDEQPCGSGDGAGQLARGARRGAQARQGGRFTSVSNKQQKNAAGRDALAEATFAGEGKEQVAGWLEGFVWKAEGGRDEPEGAIGAETTSNEDVAAEDDTEDTEDANVDSLTAKTDDLDVNRA